MAARRLDSRMNSPDVLIIGGGVIGLSIAWRTCLAGLGVTVIDPQPTAGASWVAGGMLAPVTEVHYGEETLLSLNLASIARFPSFVSELEDAAGRAVGYRPCGTLTVALDAGDWALLDELHSFQASLGLDSELVSARECRRLEPLLCPAIRGGLAVPGDHQVDNRLLCLALLEATERAGVTLCRTSVEAIDVASGRVEGVRTSDGDRLATETVVLAAGCWSNTIDGLPPEAVAPVRPVKGQILRLRGPSILADRNLRAIVTGSSVYVVPRPDGSVVVGASAEEKGYDTTVTAGVTYALLRDATHVLPGLGELHLEELQAGLRPGSPDNRPIIGPSPLDGLVIATGHYRNGILLAPITADAIASYLVDACLPETVSAFTPARFTVHTQIAGSQR